MMTDQSTALSLLQKSLGDKTASFRDGQWEAIDALVNHQKKLLVVQRTGWGKSVVYFIATRIFRDAGKGPTLIISPLLALMRNQIEAAKRLGINAHTINSTNPNQRFELENSLSKDEIDVMLISPEQLANEEFMGKFFPLIASGPGLLVVDEVHCISDWGHDFRPDYKRISNILRSMPENMPALGTTATANSRVIDDIKDQLGDICTQRGSLMRETLSLQTMRMGTPAERLAWIAEHIDELPGAGIIYVLTKRDADTVSDWLKSKGIAAESYYSDVTNSKFANSDGYRPHLEDALLNNEIKALVATTALGMGYDKPDLGFVIHYQAPSSVIAYYQQVGRAGRDIDHAVGILMSGNEDDRIHEYFRKNAFPSENHVQSVLDALEANDGLGMQDIQKVVNLGGKAN